jgi:hypothetical protein
MTREPSLRHPSEIPWYVACLVLNLLILAALIELVVLVWTHPSLFNNQALTDTAIAILFGLILLPLAYVIYRRSWSRTSNFPKLPLCVTHSRGSFICAESRRSMSPPGMAS